jgi:hypothetical protein
MKMPILSSMPRALLWTFLGMLVVGAVLFYVSLRLPMEGHEGYWTALLLHGVAEFWGFALGILVAFCIGIKLAEEKIKPLLRFVAKLREDKVIEKETARGVVMCAAKILSEEKITKNFGTSIRPKPLPCDICGLDIDSTPDLRCQHCGLKNHIWQLEKDPVEV